MIIKDSEIIKVKGNHATCMGYDLEMLESLLEKCKSPGIHAVDDYFPVEYFRYLSDGKTLKTQRAKSKNLELGTFELSSEFETTAELTLGQIEGYINVLLESDPAKTYEDINGTYCRVGNFYLYYLQRVYDYSKNNYSPDEIEYKQNKILLSAIKTIVREVKLISREESLMYADRFDKARDSYFHTQYKEGDLSYFGYQSIEGYFCNLRDNYLRIEIWDDVANNNTPSFGVSYKELKELLRE